MLSRINRIVLSVRLVAVTRSAQALAGWCCRITRGCIRTATGSAGCWASRAVSASPTWVGMSGCKRKVALKEYLPRGPGRARYRPPNRRAPIRARMRKPLPTASASFWRRRGRWPNWITPTWCGCGTSSKKHGTAYLVMDYYPGLTLAEVSARQPDGKISEDQAIGVLLPHPRRPAGGACQGFLHRT
jgi:hypothetical protein